MTAPGEATDADDIRWQGFSHQEIYDMVWAGPGHVASGTAQGMWREVAAALNGIANDLHMKTGRLRAGWEGTAAAAVERNLNLLDGGLAQAVRTALKTAATLDQQAEHVATLRNTLPPPRVREPTRAVPGGKGGGAPGSSPTLEDLREREAVDAELSRQALHVMETYSGNSRRNVPHIYPIDRPLQVTGDFAAPGGINPGPAGGGGAGLPGGVGVPGGLGTPAGPSAPLPVGVGGLPGAGTPGGANVGPGLGGGGAGGVPVPIVPGVGPAGGTSTTGRGGGFGGGGRASTPVFPPPGTSGVPGGRGFPGTTTGGVGPTEPGGTAGRGPGTGGAIPGTSPANAAPGNRGVAGTHGFFPPGAGGFGGQPREHRRPSYLVDEDDAFGDHRWFTEQVITPNDPLPRKR